MLQDDHDQSNQPVDGRAVRRERNIAAVLDVVIEMYGEDLLMPTIEQASKRSGLSLRSLYRYFSDPAELHEAAIQRHRKMTRDVAHLPAIGEGPFDERVTSFVDMRVRLYEAAAPVFRASVHSAGTQANASESLARARGELSDQFNLHFAPELTTCGKARADSADVLTQLDSIDLMRRSHKLSIKATKAALTEGLNALLH